MYLSEKNIIECRTEEKARTRSIEWPNFGLQDMSSVDNLALVVSYDHRERPAPVFRQIVP